MNTVLKGAFFLVGGATLFTGSFVGVALVTGRPAHQIPLLKNFAEKPVKPHDEHVQVAHPDSTTQEPEDSHTALPMPDSTDHRNEHTQPATASVLGAFVMPAPFNSDELAQMQSKLALRLEEIEVKLPPAKSASPPPSFQRAKADTVDEGVPPVEATQSEPSHSAIRPGNEPAAAIRPPYQVDSASTEPPRPAIDQ